MSLILCPHCGTANRAGSNFCNRCGASLRGEGLPPPAEPESAAPAALPGPEAQPAPETFPAPPAADRPPVGPPPQEPPQTPAGQPWLQQGFAGPDDAPGEGQDAAEQEDVDAGVGEDTDIPVAAGRLVSGIQGLIEPIRVATVPGEGDGEPAPAAAAPLDADRLRRVRLLMAEEPLLAAASLSGRTGLEVDLTPSPSHPANLRLDIPSLWLPWAFLLIGIVIAIPVFWQLTRPSGAPRQWPGVQEAFAAVDSLGPQTSVQILWAYDPATAGELDLLAAPLVRHLFARGAQLQIVSLLPNGPATARRLLAAVHNERIQLRRGAGEAPVPPPRFLPGGVLALPSLGQQRADLAVVFAAEAEDVQAWLEQVAPRNGVPVIAVTGAGADPLLRPYLASGQLAGLVSGYDGAAAYTDLLDELPARTRERGLELQVVGQNLATIAFLFLIVAGNLALLVGGRRGNG